MIEQTKTNEIQRIENEILQEERENSTQQRASRVAEIKEEIVGKLMRHYGRTLENAGPDHIYKAVSLCVRDQIMLRWLEADRTVDRRGMKRLYYLSAEFLMGRALANNIYNLEEYDFMVRLRERVDDLQRRIEG